MQESHDEEHAFYKKTYERRSFNVAAIQKRQAYSQFVTGKGFDGIRITEWNNILEEARLNKFDDFTSLLKIVSLFCFSFSKSSMTCLEKADGRAKRPITIHTMSKTTCSKAQTRQLYRFHSFETRHEDTPINAERLHLNYHCKQLFRAEFNPDVWLLRVIKYHYLV